MKNKNYNHNRTLPPFKKGNVTCPVCGNTHRWHCAVTIDDSLALCKYRWSDKQAKDGRYIHRQNDNLYQEKQTTETTPPIGDCGSVETERADADHMNVVYRTLLEHPILVESGEGGRPPLLLAHADHLLNERGFSDTTIAANLYTSVPDLKTLRAICDDLAGCLELKGVPGFFRQERRWNLNAFGDGFFVPYRDVKGRMVGLQIRRFGLKPKYIWLSSKGKAQGSSPGSPLHYAKPDLEAV